MNRIRIIGIMIHNRAKYAGKVQGILTKYGCSIKTRLGLNDPDESEPGAEGLIILELTGEQSEWLKLENELLELDEVEISKMDFSKSRIVKSQFENI